MTSEWTARRAGGIYFLSSMSRYVTWYRYIGSDYWTARKARVVQPVQERQSFVLGAIWVDSSTADRCGDVTLFDKCYGLLLIRKGCVETIGKPKEVSFLPKHKIIKDMVWGPLTRLSSRSGMSIATSAH